MANRDTEQAITKLRELFASVLKGLHEENLLLFDAIMEVGLPTGAVSNDELRAFVRDSMASGHTEFLDLLLQHFSEERIFSESVSALSQGFKKQFFCAMLDEGYLSVKPSSAPSGPHLDLDITTGSSKAIQYFDSDEMQPLLDIFQERYEQFTTIPSYAEYFFKHTRDWPYLSDTPINRDNFIRAHMFGHLPAWIDHVTERVPMDALYSMLDDLPPHIHDGCHRLLDMPLMSHVIANANRPHPLGEWTAAVSAQPEREAAR